MLITTIDGITGDWQTKFNRELYDMVELEPVIRNKDTVVQVT